MLSRPGKLTWYIIIINPRNSGRLQWALLVERKSQEEAEGKLCFDNMSIFVLNVFVNDILILDGPDPVLYSWISFSDKCLKEWAGVLYIYICFFCMFIMKWFQNFTIMLTDDEFIHLALYGQKVETVEKRTQESFFKLEKAKPALAENLHNHCFAFETSKGRRKFLVKSKVKIA